MESHCPSTTTLCSAWNDQRLIRHTRSGRRRPTPAPSVRAARCSDSQSPGAPSRRASRQGPADTERSLDARADQRGRGPHVRRSLHAPPAGSAGWRSGAFGYRGLSLAVAGRGCGFGPLGPRLSPGLLWVPVEATVVHQERDTALTCGQAALAARRSAASAATSATAYQGCRGLPPERFSRPRRTSCRTPSRAMPSCWAVWCAARWPGRMICDSMAP